MRIFAWMPAALALAVLAPPCASSGRAAAAPSAVIPLDLSDYYSHANPVKLIAQYEAAHGARVWPTMMALSDIPPADIKLLTTHLRDGNLSSGAAQRLRWVIAHIRERARALPLIRRREIWATNTFTGAYRKVGQRSPTWDAAAEAAITLYAVNTGLWGGHGGGASLLYNLKKDCRKAIALGCHDPLVVYLHDWQWQQGPRKMGLFFQRFMHTQIALERLLASRYPLPVKFAVLYSQSAVLVARRMTLYVRGTTDPMLAHPMSGNLQRLVTMLPAVVSDPRTPDVFFAPRMVNMSHWLHAQLHWTWRHIDRDLSAAFAHDSTRSAYFDPLLKGLMWQGIGWDVRGSGLASTVSPKEWAEFRIDERKALQLLQSDARQHPTRAVVWQCLVNLGVGAQLSQHSEMANFLHALRLDPTYFPTVDSMGWYLERRWYGSPQSETALASLLIFHGYWRSGIPLYGMNELVHAVADSPKGSYLTERILSFPQWRHKQVWGLLQAAYDQYLQRHPDDVWARSSYLHAAMVLHHWHIVLRQALAAKAALSTYPATPAYGQSRDAISQNLWHASPQILDKFANQARRHLGLKPIPVLNGPSASR